MSVEAGQPILQYRLTEKIGEGGMGEVWRATDTSLDRDVAIKVLPEGFGRDADRLARFEREAKAVASLSHPNILAIHDFGVHEGQAYAVMELLAGETLRQRMNEGALPTRHALGYARQIARGLAAAHERGVVHRDLKPENVFVTRDGIVKILDFGLAKIASDETAATSTATPTRTKLTEPGQLLGTVGYMSPEQVRGEIVDSRSDIFSFGVVLYEILAGRRPFERETAAEVMTAILREEPEELTDVDPAILRVVHHCLEKRPEERFQSARDLVFALEAGSTSSLSAGPRPVRGPASRGKRAAAVGLFVVATAVVGLLAGWWLSGRPAPGTASAAAVFKRLTFARGRVDTARFTPDGNTVIYSAQWRDEPSRLFSLAPANPESLAIGLDDAMLLDVSPDGELAIQRDTRLSSGSLVGTLGRLPLGSAAPRDVSERVLEADWMPSGDRLALLRDESYRRFVESPPGTVWYQSERFMDHLRASPVREEIAVWARRGVGFDDGEILLVSPDGSHDVLGLCSCTGLAWSPSGEEIWFSEELRSGESTFSAVTRSGQRREIWRGAGVHTIQDIAEDGTLLVTSRDRRGGILGLTPGSEDERDFSWLDWTIAAALTDDGRTLLFNEFGPGGGEHGSFYLRDLTTDRPAVRLGEGFAVDLSPDGRRVLSVVRGVEHRYTIVPTGAGQPRTIDLGDVFSAWGWFLPGRDEILVNGREAGTTWRFYIVDPDGGTPTPVTPEGVDHYRWQQTVSPDGRWVAGIVDSAPSPRLRIFPLGDEGEPFDVPGITDRDVALRWSADGESIYVFDRDTLPTEIYRVRIDDGERTLVHTLMPTDPAGIRSIEALTLTPDGRYYVYSYTRELDILYTIEGLR